MSDAKNESLTASENETYDSPAASIIEISDSTTASENDTLRQISDDAEQTSNGINDNDSTRIIKTRNFPITPQDFSMMDRDNTNATGTRTPVDANFSLARSPVDTAAGPSNPGPTNTAIDRDMPTLRNALNEDPDEDPTLQRIRRDMQRLQMQLDAYEAPNRTLRNNPNRRLSFHEHAFETTHDRYSQDIRNQRGSIVSFMSMKDARNMIPEIDGTKRNRVKEFINASSYVVKNIHPAEEHTLLEAILCTKLKDKAMTDFQTREIRNFAHLKHELEREYLGKRSTAHLQVEFHSLRQGHNESAQDFGRRADQLAMELFESMEEGKNHTSEQRQAVLENIKEQALHIYQTGLHEDIKLLVRAQRYQSLTEAITGAIAEEKVKGPSNRNGTYSNKNKFESQKRSSYPTAIQCRKCGKTGHYGQDCRTSRYADRFSLPKPEGRPRVNTVEKYCEHCRRKGHTKQECWTLNGRPERKNDYSRSHRTGRNMREGQKESHKEKRRAITAAEARSSDEEEDRDKSAPSKRTAASYRIAHLRAPRAENGLDLISLPVQEAARNKIEFLFDTGATISLIKLKTLTDETEIIEERIKLTGISGHSINTIGKAYIHILVDEKPRRHPVYVTRDDVPFDYDGILGVDFIRKNRAKCNYDTKQVIIGDIRFKLYPYKRITLPPRSETLVQVITNTNKTGITRKMETQPGIYLGECLIEPRDLTGVLSVINTTDVPVEIKTPHVTLDPIEEEDAKEVNAICEREGEYESSQIKRREKL